MPEQQLLYVAPRPELKRVRGFRYNGIRLDLVHVGYDGGTGRLLVREEREGACGHWAFRCRPREAEAVLRGNPMVLLDESDSAALFNWPQADAARSRHGRRIRS